jgi:ethanolamine utilization protein EutN
MILGRVIGQVWATRREPRLAGKKLLVIRPHGLVEPPFEGRHVVAIDDVDAGVGDDVVVCLGLPARWAAGDHDMPVDAAVLGVVDHVDLSPSALTATRAAPGIQRPLAVEHLGHRAGGGR